MDKSIIIKSLEENVIKFNEFVKILNKDEFEININGVARIKKIFFILTDLKLEYNEPLFLHHPVKLMDEASLVHCPNFPPHP